ncbi:MAG: UDP-N-acetylmuramate--L-alanine ligase [Deltaproteobacteria bacterium]|nr:UDP-N-acetylmuramate--L-alanine ligase [Deltaproteobacteria bacterium]
MGALATLLVEAGYRVTGTDVELYPPMSDQLAALNIKTFTGYAPENLAERPDLVVVGNVITKTNPEVQEVLRLGVPYVSMPQALADFFLTKRSSLVVAGTHGKTTTATLLAWLLSAAEEDPGFLIGGVPKNFGKSAAIGKGPFFVVEGDEYDTAFFDKGPKFLHYQPQAAILTSVEFDHADIYHSLDEIKAAFRRFIALIPPDGLLIACGDDRNVKALAREVPCRTIFYGANTGNDYVPQHVLTGPEGTSFDLSTSSGTVRFQSPLFGDHNLANVTACLALLCESGISPTKLRDGLLRFQGVKRRQEIVGESKSVTIVDDFAHHPTAIKKTIAAMRSRFPGRRLWAIFEPRSHTSRRNIFQKDFVDALKGADRVVIAGVYKSELIPEAEQLDPQKIADTLFLMGPDAHYIPDTPSILEYVIRNIDHGDVVLIMSNGGFDDIHHKLLEKLAHRRIVDDMSKIRPSRVPKPRS